LERLKTSSVAIVSYHVRPPTPFYKGSDTIGLSEMSGDELYETILPYMEHAVDGQTGLTTQEAGGYQLLKDVMGYAPPIVGMVSEPPFEQTLVDIYQQKGATFVIVHDAQTNLGDTKRGMFVRPEHMEVKLFERLQESPESYLAQAFEAYEAEGPVFLTVKMHDNDFFATDSAWVSIYVKDRRPPFDLSLGETNRSRLSEKEQEAVWSAYETAVSYAAEHRDEYGLINATDLLRLIEEWEAD
jgi:hypothetical protein